MHSQTNSATSLVLPIDHGLGEKQWACLRELEKRYINAPMNLLSGDSSFIDDVWESKGATSRNLNWGEWFPRAEHYPLKLLLKVYAYTHVQHKGMSINTIKPRLIGFISTFKSLFESQNIIVAQPDSPFKCLVELGMEDIQLITQTNIVSSGSINETYLELLRDIKSLPASVFTPSEFAVDGLLLPWDEGNVTLKKWIKSVKKSFKVVKEKVPYSPLTYESLSDVVTHALMVVNDYGEIITKIYDEVNASSKSRKWIAYAVRTKVLKQYPEIEGLQPFCYISERGKKVLSEKWFTNLTRLVLSSTAWLVLLTTGLRSIDMRKLNADCCIRSNRNNSLYYLVTDIKKTKIIDHVIPVPEQTARVIALANKVKYSQESKLVFNKRSPSAEITDKEVNDLHYIREDSAFNDLLSYLGEYFDFEINTTNPSLRATAHCGRATLAGYIGANSNAAILIVKKLFGHSNSLMPDAYLNHNPYVIQERNRSVLEAQESLAKDMAKAIGSGQVAGVKGRQMKDGAEEIKNKIKLENQSLTEMDMQVKLEARLRELLLARMTGGHVFALLTPMSVVCMRSCSDTTDSPCSIQKNHVSRKSANISKKITDTLSTMPDPANCVGEKCTDALFGASWSRPLLDTFKFYTAYLDGAGQVYDIQQEAKRFFESYGDILSELYGESYGGI